LSAGTGSFLKTVPTFALIVRKPGINGCSGSASLATCSYLFVKDVDRPGVEGVGAADSGDANAV